MQAKTQHKVHAIATPAFDCLTGVQEWPCSSTHTMHVGPCLQVLVSQPEQQAAINTVVHKLLAVLA